MKKRYEDQLKAIDRKINTIKFANSLWQKVEPVDTNDIQKGFKNADFKYDDLFPEISVSGYNELNGCEESHRIPCYVLLDDMSKSDWREEYKLTGDSPAYSNTAEVMSAVFAETTNLRCDYEDAMEQRRAIEAKIKMLEDSSKYYLLGHSLVGKQDDGNAYLFIGGKWIEDDENVIGKLLIGEDLTKQEFTSFPPESVELINSIVEVDKENAMGIIAKQTLSFLLDKWKEDFEEEKKAWDEIPGFYSKNVSVVLSFYGTEFVLEPEDFLFEKGPYDDSFIEYISRNIREDVKEYGGNVLAFYGDMD